MPYSPKTAFVPPLAAPDLPGWCCLRCLTRRGMSIGQLSSVLGVSVAGALGVPASAGAFAGSLLGAPAVVVGCAETSGPPAMVGAPPSTAAERRPVGRSLRR